MRPVIVTAMYGGSDELRPQAAQDLDVEWHCFTDDPRLEAPAPWVVHVEAPVSPDPCLAAKRYKVLVHEFFPHALEAIWIDASMQITSPAFAREALAARHDGIATFRHPRRDCIYTEAEASLGAEGQNGKYAGLPLLEQVAAYLRKGHPQHGGLYACGVLAWDLTDRRARELAAAWWDECARWSIQDQLSFPVVCRRLGISPGVFPLRQIERHRPRWLENRWLRIWPHCERPR